LNANLKKLIISIRHSDLTIQHLKILIEALKMLPNDLETLNIDLGYNFFNEGFVEILMDIFNLKPWTKLHEVEIRVDGPDNAFLDSDFELIK